MKLVVQRVLKATVSVDQEIVGSIDGGLCIFVAVAPTDTPQTISKMAQKLCHLRIFSDSAGKMNLSLLDTGGEALIISQFTLLADCQTGRRPSFTGAGDPVLAKELYLQFVEQVKSFGIPVQTGSFGAHMLVRIENDGPATFLLESA